MTCVLDAPSSSDADPRSSTAHAERRLKSVPMGCYGNGRRMEPPRNNKWPRKHENEVFVPSQALADIMKTMPEVRSTQPQQQTRLRREVRSSEGIDTITSLTSFDSLLVFVVLLRPCR